MPIELTSTSGKHWADLIPESLPRAPYLDLVRMLPAPLCILGSIILTCSKGQAV